MQLISSREDQEALTSLLYQIDAKNQTIYYGPPGTGKSRRVKQLLQGTVLDKHIFRTTFHPDYTYEDFVGSYRPVTVEETIHYKFVAGVFLKAYVKSRSTSLPVVLVIDELSRGNCSAIFGDMFQLLDRKPDTGMSEYEVTTSEDIERYLASEGIVNPERIQLPRNLYIFATMNTSDQSIFPMDSAFKRRWEWEYVPVDPADAQKQQLNLCGSSYSWAYFIQHVNENIYSITESEDKQLGNRFVNAKGGVIDQDSFIGKVMFYLWNDVFKNEDPNNEDNIFKYLDEDQQQCTFRFTDLYGLNRDKILAGFLRHIGLSPLADPAVSTVEVDAEAAGVSTPLSGGEGEEGP